MLKADPSTRGVLLTEKPLTPKEDREKMTEIMFETFNSSRFYLAMDALLSLYSAGGTTGLVVDSGDSSTRIVPIYEGKCISDAIQTSKLRPGDFTEYLRKMLMEKGYSFTDTDGRESRDIVRNIKESLCYVALDHEKELKDPVTDTKFFKMYYNPKSYVWTDRKKAMNEVFGPKFSEIINQYLPQSAAQDFEFKSIPNRDYVLPDGKVITVGMERFKTWEPFIKPELVGLEQEGIHKMIRSAIFQCDRHIRGYVAGNIVMAGGNCMWKGNMARRLKNEVKKFVSDPNIYAVNVTASENGCHSAWMGGSVLASLSAYQEMWIRKWEYDESGSSIVHRKCM